MAFFWLKSCSETAANARSFVQGYDVCFVFCKNATRLMQYREWTRADEVPTRVLARGVTHRRLNYIYIDFRTMDTITLAIARMQSLLLIASANEKVCKSGF